MTDAAGATTDTGEGRRALRRRGLVAGAAALIAGVAAKRAADANPVAASGDKSFSAYGPDTYGFQTTGTFTVGVSATGGNIGVSGGSTSGVGVSGQSTSGYGVYGISFAPLASGTAGVAGSGTTAVRGAGTIFGVSGTGQTGVFGQTNGTANSGTAGVYGGANAVGTYGVVGDGFADGTGVFGQNATYGVLGQVANVANSVAVYGDNQSDQGTNNIGVYGTSNTGYGVLGVTNKPGFSGVTGSTFVAGTAAFAGGTATPGAYAAYFTGPTVVQGDFTVIGGQKNAAVKHTDGSYRLLHCVESPEPWFEDFGTGTLVNGKADVKLDPDFAAVVQAEGYLVFLTPYDGVGSLRAARRTAAGFAVEEIGGASGGTFGWRVAAKRKDLGKVQRLATFAVPQIKAPGTNDLPKAPAPARTPEQPRAAAPPPRAVPPAPSSETAATPATSQPIPPQPAPPQPTSPQPTPLPAPPSRP